MAEEIKLGGSLSKINTELREIKANLIAATDPKQIEQLSKKAAELSDKIADANEQVKIFATGSKFEQASNALGQVRDAFFSLDFEKLSERAKTFSSIVKTISFSEIIGGVKNLGSAVLTFGKILLTNPIFLLGAVIVGIVAGLGALLNAFGLLKPLLDGIKAILGSIVAGFNALTDFLGFTSNAAQASYEGVKKAEEGIREELTSSAKERESIAKSIQGLTKEQIADIEKRTGVELSSISTLDSARLQSENSLRESYGREIAAFEQLETKKGTLSEDEQKSLDELRVKYQDTSLKIIEIEANRERELTKIEERLANKRLEILGNGEDKIKAKLTKQIKDLGAEQSKLIQELNNATTQEERVRLNNALQQNIEYQELLKKESLEAQDKLNQDNFKKAVDANTKLAQQRLKDLEISQKIELNKLEEGSVERLEKEQEFLNQSLDFYKKYQQALGLSNNEIILKTQETEKAIESLDNKITEIYRKGVTTFSDFSLNMKDASDENLKAYETQIENFAKRAKEQADIAFESITESKKNFAFTDEEKGKIQEGFDLVKNGIGAISGLSDLYFTVRKSNLEKGSAEEEKAAKKEFEVRKKINVASTILSGIQGVVNILSSSSLLPEPVASIYKGVQIAALAATTAASVAKISSSQFGGTSGSVGSVGGTTPTVASTSPAVPSFNLFGQGNNQNTVQATNDQEVGGNQNLNVNVSVSETEITATQLRVNRMRESSEL